MHGWRRRTPGAVSPLPRPPDESERAGNRCPGGPLRPGVAERAGVRPRTAATPSGPPCGELRLRGTGATLIVRARRGTRRFRPSAADPPRLDRPWQCPRHGAPPPSGVFEQATRPRSARPARRPPTPASPRARPGSRGTGRLDHTRGIAEGSTSSPPSAPTSWNDRSVGPRSSLPPWEPFRARRRNRSTGTSRTSVRAGEEGRHLGSSGPAQGAGRRSSTPSGTGRAWPPPGSTPQSASPAWPPRSGCPQRGWAWRSSRLSRASATSSCGTWPPTWWRPWARARGTPSTAGPAPTG